MKRLRLFLPLLLLLSCSLPAAAMQATPYGFPKPQPSDGTGSAFINLWNGQAAAFDALLTGAIGYTLGESTCPNLPTALNYIGSQKACLTIPKSLTLGANTTIPANIVLKPAPGAIITLGSYNLAVNGPVIAGPWQWISQNGTGVATFGYPTTVYPEWWVTNTAPGTTDMLPALNAAHASLVNCGGEITLSNTNYAVSATFVMLNSYITLAGKGRSASQIVNLSTTTDAIQVGSPSVGPCYVKIKDLSIMGSGTMTAGAGINVIRGFFVYLDDLIIFDHFKQILIGTNTYSLSFIYVNRIWGSYNHTPPTNGVGIELDGGSGNDYYFSNLVFDSGAFPNNVAYGMKISGGDCIHVDRAEFVQMGTGVLISPIGWTTAETVSDVWFNKVLCDTCYYNGVYIYNWTSGTNIARIYWNDCSFGSCSQKSGTPTWGIDPAVFIGSVSGSTVDTIEFNHCQNIYNGGRGYDIEAGSNISITGGLISNCGKAGDSSNAQGILTAGSLDSLRVTGVRIGPQWNLADTMSAPIYLSAGNHLIIKNNDWRGNTAGGFVDLTSTGDKYIINNLGFTPGNALAPNVPASTTVIQNTKGFPIKVTVSGGTVTAIKTGSASGSLTATGLTSGQVDLPAGWYIAITYSQAPTWVWEGVQ